MKTTMEKVAEYRQQTAIYVNAIEEILGVFPDARLCFLGRTNQIYTFPEKELMGAWEALGAR